MNLQLPPDTEEFRAKPLRKSDLRFLKRVLLKTEAVPDRYVRTLVATPEPTEEDTQVARLVEALHGDYDGVVLGTEVLPDPPIRGPEGAILYRTRPFSMQGEKLEAHKKSRVTGRNTNISKGQSLEWL